jgi:hypothetical protein
MRIAGIIETLRAYRVSIVGIIVITAGIGLFALSQHSHNLRADVPAPPSSRELAAQQAQDARAAASANAAYAAWSRRLARDNARRDQRDQKLAAEAGDGSTSTTAPVEQTTPQPSTTTTPVTQTPPPTPAVIGAATQPSQETPTATDPAPQTATAQPTSTPSKVQPATLTVSKATRAARNADQAANQDVVNNGVSGFPGAWDLNSAKVTGCDRLEATIVECRVESIFHYFPDMGVPGEATPNVGGETCEAAYRVTIQGMSTFRISLPSPRLCTTWAYNTPGAPTP